MEQKKRIWLMAGEASGDAYGAAVANALKERCAATGISLILRGMGASKMREAGVETFVDSTELGIIGLLEVLKALPFFIRLLRDVTRRAAEERPDTVILIDYPGFNIRLAKRLHQLGIRVIWYVSPQVWAWKKGRIWKLAKYCEQMLCIFPFEPKCYAPTTLNAQFVGHPLLEMLEPYRQMKIPRDENLVLLLPGSRTMEIKRLMKDFLNAAAILHRQNPALHFEIPLPREKILILAKEIYGQMTWPDGHIPPIRFSVGKTRERMCAASAAIAASGTVTVEAALLDLPVVVAYKLSAFTWTLARMVIKLPSITIANLVCQTTVFEERLQNDCTPENLAASTQAILPNGPRHQSCMDLLAKFRQLLGQAGNVSDNVARIALNEE